MTIDLSNLPSADRHAVAAKICRTTTTSGAVERIITDQLDEAVRVRDLTDRLTVGRKVDRVRDEYERQQAELDRQIREAREVDAAAAEARKGQTVDEIIDAAFDNL